MVARGFGEVEGSVGEGGREAHESPRRRLVWHGTG